MRGNLKLFFLYNYQVLGFWSRVIGVSNAIEKNTLFVDRTHAFVNIITTTTTSHVFTVRYSFIWHVSLIRSVYLYRTMITYNVQKYAKKYMLSVIATDID